MSVPERSSNVVLSFLRKRQEAEQIAATVPKGIRVYAIGDIHGRADLLMRLHDMVIEDAKASPGPVNYLVYLGDYVDRGLHSRQVIDLMIGGPPPTFGSVHLRGNHEATFQEFLNNPSVGPGWFKFGGLATLHSYGIQIPSGLTPEERVSYGQQELRRVIPPSHVSFLNHLRPSLTIGDYFFTHAGIRPGVALNRQQKDDMMWIRDDFLNSTVDHGKVVVHGHTICDLPEVRNNRIGIDTGAYASGHLTCLVLEGDRRRFLAT
ncbi:metallophosphoesterase family protein [Skermanella stibiiresistens]|jgi:serine/threonine protein phosphatase 1|uniref:metallophosphoesterase family protein n=1 Tax=Skermanella stibiiresistens TaxID=913326 RepID=UPI0009FEF8C2|nr:metallophosphoesterase family protein [Skermanella stibiiresistens]